MISLSMARLYMAIGALLGAGIFLALGLPLPWLIGPMITTVILKIKYPSKIFFPVKWRNLFLIPLGYNIGAHITLDACHEIMAQIMGITVSTALSIGISLVLAWWMVKRTGITMASSAVGNMPGGLTPMLLLCESIPSADINAVAVIQSIRLMSTIAVVPILLTHGFGATAVDSAVLGAIHYLDIPAWQLIIAAVAGALAAHKINFPAAFFMGPIVAIGAFSLYLGGNLPEAPDWLIALSQVCTGLFLGTCIDPFQLGQNKKLLPVTLAGALILIVSSLFMGFLLSKYYGFTLATAFLATAPGGVAEMSITGMVLGENVPIILAYQLFRMLVLNIIMPPALKWYFTR